MLAFDHHSGTTRPPPVGFYRFIPEGQPAPWQDVPLPSIIGRETQLMNITRIASDIFKRRV